MKYPPQKLCSILLALIMLVGIVPAGILTVEAGSAPCDPHTGILQT